MTLRCFLFSSDEGTAAILRQILSNLGIEGEFCSTAVTAAERITNQPFQIVIIDWDQQPEAGLLLGTAQERKAAERPLTLAVVSNDGDAPKALHAGANSLLRKPIVPSQAKDTLTTARDLLSAKQGAVPTVARIAQVAPRAPEFHVTSDQSSASLRAGDFLQSPTVTPGENFETEASVPQLPDEFAMQAIVRPVKELEPMAAAVVKAEDIAESVSGPSGTRGLEWYLKHKVSGGLSANSGAAPAMAAIPAATHAANQPQVITYDQSQSSANPAGKDSGIGNRDAKPALKLESSAGERRKEAELFAYIQGETPRSAHQTASSGFQFPKRALVPALILATIAIIATPQAPWHAPLQKSWSSATHSLHSWLNPQPVTPTQVPLAHESFTRAGDEYKLPVAEQIPDATTDPSQIEVVPVTDPSIKKTNPEGGNAMDPSAVPLDTSRTVTETSPQNAPAQTSNAQPPSANADPFRAAGQPPSAPVVRVIETPVISAGSSGTGATSPGVKPAVPASAQPYVVTPSGMIPPSLTSQIAPANTSVVNNKPLDAAAPAIEPVQVAENTERALITDGPAPIYPNNAKGQQGTVVLQLLIARDGTVADAKFVQGSLLFARNAIDAVKQWKFKPYFLNGRPVSVQTQLTLRFKPA